MEGLGTIKPAGVGRGYRRPPTPRPLAAALVRVLIRAVGRLPLSWAHALGGTLARLAAILPGRTRERSRRHLRWAFPEADPAEIARLTRASIVESGKMMVEHGAFWSWPRERLLARIVEVRGGEHLDRARAEGRGVVLGGIHLGSIEALNVYCVSTYGVTSQYRMPRIRELDPFFRHARERFGARLLPTGRASVRLLLEALDRGECVGIPPDQDAGTGQGIFVPFFGRLANTMTLIPRLAARRRPLVVIAWAERLPRARYRVHFEPVDEAVGDRDLVRAATTLNEAVERCVRRCPEQYLWSYSRWRIRPGDVPGLEREARASKASVST